MTRLPPVPLAAAVATLIVAVVAAVLFLTWRVNRSEQPPALRPASPRVLS